MSRGGGVVVFPAVRGMPRGRWGSGADLVAMGRGVALFLLLLGGVVGVFGASTPAQIIGTDPFSLVTEGGTQAISLQDSRVVTGTRVILAEWLGGRRGDQSLVLKPTAESGWWYLAFRASTGVLELVGEGAAGRLELGAPAEREGQKWRIEQVTPGRYRVVGKRAGVELAVTPGARAALAGQTGAVQGGAAWGIRLQPISLGEDTGRDTLDRQLEVNREPWMDRDRVARAITAYLARTGPEVEKGFRLLLAERVHLLAPDTRNWALTLFLELLTRGAWEAGDSITLALALANASLYADGDEEVRARLRADVVAHYQLYQEVAAWQEGWVIRYRLKELPLLAKVLWSYRANQLEQNGHVLTLEEYETFVDRIDVIRRLHEMARAAEPGEASTLRGVVAALDRVFQSSYKYAHFMAMIRQWYTPEAPLPPDATDDQLYAWLTRPEVAALLPVWVAEVLEDYRSGTYYVEVLGRRRDPQARMWVNYQWELYQEGGFFRGDCGTEAEVSMALWKAAGMAATAIYHTGKDIGHAYPMYYDPFVGRFESLQDLSPMREKFGADAEVTFHPMPLRLHDGIPAVSPRPVTTVGPYTRFVARGMDYASWERMFLRRGTLPAESVFTPEASPSSLVDTDRDGLYDEDEIARGTHPTAADTDRDGFSDPWEIERGFDARDPAAPTRPELGRVLVGHVVRIVSAGSSLPLAGSGAGHPGLTWRIVRSDEAQYHYLVSAQSGLALTGLPGGSLTQAPLTGGAPQKWKLLYRDAGSFVIQSRADSTVIAATAERGVVARGPRGTPDERWLIR